MYCYSSIQMLGIRSSKKKINRDYIAEERKTLQPLRTQKYSLHGVFYDQNPEMALEECHQNTAAWRPIFFFFFVQFKLYLERASSCRLYPWRVFSSHTTKMRDVMKTYASRNKAQLPTQSRFLSWGAPTCNSPGSSNTCPVSRLALKFHGNFC